MSFLHFLNELFESDNGYNTSKSKFGNNIIFDIDTEEDRNYRFIFKHIKDGLYVSELGYVGNSKDDTNEISGDFYDVNKVISTLVGIFTSLYLDETSIEEIVYKFQLSSNKSYRLLINSIFKKELKNYYNIVDLEDDSNFDTKRFLLIKSNRTSQVTNLTTKEIIKILKK